MQNEDISKLTETRTNRGSGRNVEILPTIKTPLGGGGGEVGGEERVKVTEMIKGFLFCFEIFHFGFSLRIGKFGKYKKYIRHFWTMLAAQFRLSDAKKINSADGTMNKPTTNIYFLFFGVQNHLILNGKLSGLGNFSPTYEFFGFVGNPTSL